MLAALPHRNSRAGGGGAGAQFLLLAALATTLDPDELDAVLAEGRAIVDSMVAAER
jgi:hypothetical protein